MLQLAITTFGLVAPPTANSGVEAKARHYFSLGNTVKQQLGPTNAEDLEAELHPDFEFVAPLVGPLNKQAIIGATTGLDLGAGLPDFDARYHDFRADAADPNRIWCTMRVSGTHTGVLNFAGIKAEPKSPPTRVVSPPEAVSLRFDATTGQLRELTTGYPIDSRVGTTSGLGGLFGILEGLGYPLPTPLTRTSGEILRPVLRAVGAAPPAEASTSVQASLSLSDDDRLPEPQLLELASELIASGFGAQRPELLAEHFTLSGPYSQGYFEPQPKKAFLAASTGFASVEAALPDLNYNYRDLRACQYDANRVWFTSSPTGTHSAPLRLGAETYAPTGRRWEGPPECGSVTFDKEGKCLALTAGYVMDRRMGNTEGMAGLYGLCVALGVPTPSPLWLLRTPTQNWARLTGSS